ncbi:hypothetical protein [Geosporobacter ferrireducens]|uniref:hypothetical protein n=1 Tax=Geosporobacter ferrireducens TaxID=1424294 RepID=UPI00139C2BAA|nr:hypothetical protein [Geosporobacter ferrireducens]MTI57479.1 hypothetical protein [Geosporobacter ferrireducens]
MKYTSHLGLKKPEPNDYFDQENHANYNMDVIDSNITSHLADYTTFKNNINSEVMQSPEKSLTIQMSNTDRIKTIDTPVKSFIDATIKGRMVVNLLGRDGNCEDVSKWIKVNSASITLDTSVKLFGNSGFNFSASGLATSTYIDNIPIVSSKFYFARAGLYAKSVTNIAARLIVTDAGGFTNSVLKDGDTSKLNTWQPLGIKFTNKNNCRLSIGFTGDTTANATMDGIMLIEITEEEYNTLTVDQLLAKYPYVDSAQPLQNPVIEVRGKNLFDLDSYVGRVGSSFISKDGSILKTINRGYHNSKCPIYRLKPNTSYIFSCDLMDSTNMLIEISTPDAPLTAAVTWLPQSNNTKRFVTSGSKEYHIKIMPEANNLSLRNIQLEEGTTATAYESFRKTQSIIPTMLGKIGSYEDELKLENGVVKKVKRIEEKVLDGSLSYSLLSNYTGYKQISIDYSYLSNIAEINGAQIVTKYDGKILIENGSAAMAPDTFKNASWLSPKRFVIGISITDSGWGDSYTPTADEIKAYFMGWKMYNGTSGDVRTTYEGSGGQTKAWAKTYYVKPDSGAVGAGNFVTILPTNSYLEYTPYQLFYALANPIEEIISPIGELPLLEEGINHVTIESGRVYERANPLLYDGNYYVNTSIDGIGLDASRFTFKTTTINNLFKKGNNAYINDTANWVINAPPNNRTGLMRARIAQNLFDSTAEYFVEYELLHEEYNSQVFTAEIQYDQNLRTTLNTALEVASNMKQAVDVAEFNVQTTKKDFMNYKNEQVKFALFRKSTHQSIPNSTATEVTWDTETPYNGEDFAEIDTTIKRIKVSKGGVYEVKCTIGYENTSGAGLRTLLLTNQMQTTTTTTGGSTYVSTSAILSLTAGSLISAQAFQTSGAALNVKGGTGETFIIIRKVGDL